MEINGIVRIAKNQHYVPRFYMKPFSVVKNEGNKNEKAFISFYQFKNNLLKDNVPTASVCSENFFYDKDGKIENRLAQKEHLWASAFLKINQGERLNEKEINDIREFVIYQMSRTKAMLNHHKEMVTTIITDIVHNEHSSLDKSVINNFVKKKVEAEITSEDVLDLVEELVPVIDDLEIVILENKTEVAFFTSDVPVVVVNPLKIHSAGLGNIGTIIFFPVSRRKMVMLYDSKLYGTVTEKIQDPECINSFNKYQFVSADERILALNSKEFEMFIQDTELNFYRERFHISKKSTTIYDGAGTFAAAKSRSLKYYFDIPFFKLPKSLKKIPMEFRETFPRNYSYEVRRDMLCRIYREPDFIEDKELKIKWKERQRWEKELLKYLDYYWNTPMEDRVITGELMRQIKTTPVHAIIPQGKK